MQYDEASSSYLQLIVTFSFERNGFTKKLSVGGVISAVKYNIMVFYEHIHSMANQIIMYQLSQPSSLDLV